MKIFEKLRKHKLCYLATPYTRYRQGIHMANVEACRAAASLISMKISVLSPIAHSHAVAMYGNLDPLQQDFWQGVDAPFLEMCDAMIVMELPGWLESRGVQHEIAVFDTAAKPVYYLSPEALA